MTFPRYSELRNSGSEWLGMVPTHWEVYRLKWSLVESKNGTWGEEPIGDHNDIICVRVADFDRQRLRVRLTDPTIRNVAPKDRRDRMVQQGDLLLEKSGGGDQQPVGYVVLFDHDIPAVCSNFIARIKSAPGMSSSYWCYVHAAAYAVRLTTKSINQTSGIQNLDQYQYFQERVAFPPVGEQAAIVAFLDRQTERIDALIDEQRRLIQLLQEKRQAVVTQAVTKGLNHDDIEMADTGIEWLGISPSHWQLMRLATLFRETAEAGGEQLPVLSVSIHHGVSDKELDEDELDRKVTRSEDRSKYIRVLPGDLVYNMMRAWQGAFGTVKVEGLVSPAYVVARPKLRMCTEYVEQLLRTPQAIEELRRHSHGVTDFRLRLYWDEFKSIKIAFPPFEERLEIMQFITSETGKFDALIGEAERAIALLQERRTAIISAAVTGKIDVRGAVAAEPRREAAA